MLSVKLIDDYIIKSQDIKTFQIQLLRDGRPHAIPEDCTVNLIIANPKAIVKEEEMVVVDAEQGIVQFTLHATIGTGSFDCEFVLSNGDDINLTFPDNGYTVLKVSPCLTERPIEVITKSEYEKLNEKIDNIALGDIDLSDYVTKKEFNEVVNSLLARIVALEKGGGSGGGGDGDDVVTATYALDKEGNQLLDADGNKIIIKEG